MRVWRQLVGHWSANRGLSLSVVEASKTGWTTRVTHPGLKGGHDGVESVLRGRCQASTAGNDALYCKLPDCDAALSFQIAAVRLTFTRVKETITHRALWRSQQWDSNGARGVVGGAVGACKPAGSTVALFAVLRCSLSLAGVRYEVVRLLRFTLYLLDAALEHCAQGPNVDHTWWVRRPRAT